MSRYLAGTIVMSALLLVYLGFALVYASILLRDDSLIVKGMGVALLILPLLGAWGLFAEWRFGVKSSRLKQQLERDGDLPEFPHTPGGRPLKDQALEQFPQFQSQVESEPESWKAWFRLGIAYDACGDRRRARWAVRKAIQISESR